MAKQHIAAALDVTSLGEAEAFASEVVAHVGVLKVGLELFVAEGPRAVSLLGQQGAELFLDLKLHDIPETVRRAVARAAGLGVKYLTIHASGGRAMVEAAARAADGSGLRILAVTVLTSMTEGDLGWIGVARPLGMQALELGKMALDMGAHGLVCSPQEASKLRAAFPEAILVTPGVRPAGADLGDQRRVATAREAILSGSSLLVVGRPLRDAPNRRDAARSLEEEVAVALRERGGASSHTELSTGKAR